ncbi:MAG: hypothetical protein LUQ69_10620 [Methanoregulaceae archaeon]|nr:hypothetical protein [Methanoregulaceae archaeon]
MIEMIGDMIGELTGKVVGQRIIRRHHTGELKMERTIESKGKILGTDVTFLATIRSWERPHGGMYALGDGIMTTVKGEKIVLHGSGISVAGKGTGLNMRGVRYAQTASPSFARLNNAALVFELEILPDGTVHDTWWEWK